MSLGPSGEKLGGILPATIQMADVGAVSGYAVREAVFVVPFNCEVTKVYGAGNASGTVKMEVYDESLATPASILTAPIDITTDYEGHTSDVSSSNKQFAEGTVLSVRVHTGTGALKVPSMTLILKKLDMTFGDAD